MADVQFSVSELGNGQIWLVLDDSRKNHLVASSPIYDCALMIAALMNFDLVQAIQYRDNLLRTTRP